MNCNLDWQDMTPCGSGGRTGKTNVLIVDDHQAVRRGLTQLLSEQPDLAVCGAVASAEQALETVEREPIDLAIVDISLEHMDGITLADALKRRHPEIVILILSMHDEHFYGPRALRAGAAGFVAKQDAPDTIVEAIHEVLSGRPYFRCRS
jgi:two-component system invasion response regulator UvrY